MKSIELDAAYTPDSFAFDAGAEARIMGGGVAMIPDTVAEDQEGSDGEFFPVMVISGGRPVPAVGRLEGDEYDLHGSGTGDPVVSIHGYLPEPGDEPDVIVEESERIIDDDGGAASVGWVYYELRMADEDNPEQGWEATIQSWFKRPDDSDAEPVITDEHGAETHRIDDIPASVAALPLNERKEWNDLVVAYLERNFDAPGSLPEQPE